ncbi:FIST N-terminal domain-containing protein [Hydrogenimonas sp.]
MRTYMAVYDSILTFHTMPGEEIQRARTVLVQIFSARQSAETTMKIAEEARLFFPKAVVVGLSTYENVTSQKARETRPVIVVTTFDDARITASCLRSTEKSGMEGGRELAKKVLRSDTKLLLLYGDSSASCMDELLRGIDAVRHGVPLVGMGASHDPYSPAHLILDGEKAEGGAVLLGFGGEDLAVETRFHSDIRTVGPKMRALEARKCRLLDLDGEKPRARIAHYLGEEFFKELPENAREMALVQQRGDRLRALSITDLHEDGTIRLSGDVAPGTILTFGYLPDTEERRFEPPALASAQAHLLFTDPSMTIHRRGDIHRVVEALSGSAPVSGGFGTLSIGSVGGESCTFTHGFVTVAMSETPKSAKDPAPAAVSLPGSPTDPSTRLGEMLVRLSEILLSEYRLHQEASKRLMQESTTGVLIYDEKLRLVEADSEAERLLALSARLDASRSLTVLDAWVVESLRQGLKKGHYTRIGKLFEPLTAQTITLELATMPLEIDGRPAGGLAMIKEL